MIGNILEDFQCTLVWDICPDIYPSNVVTFVTKDCIVMYLSDEVENAFEMLQNLGFVEMLDNRAIYMWISRAL